ncbi:MAG: YbaB/EbfC family nucleoid-associated protein [Kiritimatiellae bacterium]|nr:YbaB/EbfC family nucleoid-associated protein [Kiritimatiellia bacterium]
MPNIMKLMKQVKTMQSNLGKKQEELEAMELEYTAGGGAVTVKIRGSGTITGIALSDAAAQGGDKEMLEDLLLTAIQGAQALAKETTEREMGKLTAGLNLPPGFGF